MRITFQRGKWQNALLFDQPHPNAASLHPWRRFGLCACYEITNWICTNNQNSFMQCPSLSGVRTCSARLSNWVKERQLFWKSCSKLVPLPRKCYTVDPDASERFQSVFLTCSPMQLLSNNSYGSDKPLYCWLKSYSVYAVKHQCRWHTILWCHRFTQQLHCSQSSGYPWTTPRVR